MFAQTHTICFTVQLAIHRDAVQFSYTLWRARNTLRTVEYM